MRIVKKQERWFECVDDPDKGQILLRPLSPGERQDIIDETLPQKINYEEGADGTMRPVFSAQTDRRKEREMTITAVVAGWKNFFDEDGKLLAFTVENLVRAAREIEGFYEFVMACQATLHKDLTREKGEQEKN